jgi:hypothetical protein
VLHLGRKVCWSESCTNLTQAGQMSKFCNRVRVRRRMLTLLIVLLVLMLVGAAPAWPYSRNWGYFPSGGLGLVLLIVVILLLTGRI